MAATLIAKVTNYQLGDEAAIDLDQFQAALGLYHASMMTATEIKIMFELDAEQGAELDEILATRPALLADIFTRAQWSSKIRAILVMGFRQAPGHETPNDCRVAMGLAPL